MAVAHQLGRTVFSDEDWTRAFISDRNVEISATGVRIGSRMITSEELEVNLVEDSTGRTSPFEPIGVHKPLMARLVHLYTGRYPKKGLVRERKKRLLVTSLVGTELEKSSRAINFLSPGRLGRRASFEPSTATVHGSRLLYYKPSLTDGENLIDLGITIAFDDFDTRPWEVLAHVLQNAAVVPMFAAASGYLVASSQGVRLATEAVNDYFEGRSSITFNFRITIHFPGFGATPAGIKIVSQGRPSPTELGVRFDTERNEIVTENGHAYDGDEPLAVIHLDGHEYPSFNSFQPSKASAEVLREFMGMRENHQGHIEQLTAGIQAINDLTYWRRSQRLLAGRSASSLSEDEQKRYDSLIRNITSNSFREAVGLPQLDT